MKLPSMSAAMMSSTEVRVGGAGVRRDHAQRPHRHGARLELHGLARAGQLVAPLAADLDRRIHRGDLRRPPGLGEESRREEPVRRGRGILREGAQLGAQALRHVRARDDLAVGVERRRAGAERHARGVALVGRGQVRRELRPLAHQRDEHAGGERIERARVPDAPLAERPAEPRDDVVTGEPRRLVDDEHAVERGPPSGGGAVTQATRSGATRACRSACPG